MGRASDVLAGDVLPRARAGAGQGEAGARERRAVQDRDVGQPRGDREAADGGSREDPRRHADRHDGRRVQRRGEEVARTAPRIRAGSGPTPSSPTCRCRRCCKYLRANGYKTYIVTGGGQDFVRVYSEKTYGIPPEQVVGTAGGDEVRLRQGRQAVPDQGAEAAAERQQRRQARRHPPDDRPPARMRRSATRPATSRCWSTPRPATARGS